MYLDIQYWGIPSSRFKCIWTIQYWEISSLRLSVFGWYSIEEYPARDWVYLDNTILRNLQLQSKCIWTIQYWGISSLRLSVSGQYSIEELGVQDRVVYGKTDTRVYWRLYLDWYGFILYTKFYLHIDFRINLTQFVINISRQEHQIELLWVSINS